MPHRSQMLAVDRDVGATVEKGRAVGLEDSGSWFSHFLEAKVVKEVALTCNHSWG